MAELTICISSFGDRIANLINWNFDNRIEYLIIWQKGEMVHVNQSFPPNVRIVINDSIGVARSRNHGLELCNTKWLWFMDDDVDIPKDSIDLLLAQLPSYEERDMLITSVDFGTQYQIKRFEENKNPLLKSFGVGTIQIICRPALARRHGCLFPINMGAGSRFPLCDEPIFISRMMRNARVRLVGVPQIIVKHPPISSGKNFRGAGYLISRAMLFREAFGFPLCIAASILFYLKHIKSIGLHFPFLFCYLRPN